ncbi:hypothetical protein KIPB_006957 [Kipferlia bialata]|uniref:Uncharacterized protein n=1 Tax=Kipferlia bialata TaxID=797122 RepID=A0A9K3CZC5_9EUKA|nr:hypothetical protein KIPB_006957 [Kipferlia bialata]|eukprot:g6957.t1
MPDPHVSPVATGDACSAPPSPVSGTAGHTDTPGCTHTHTDAHTPPQPQPQPRWSVRTLLAVLQTKPEVCAGIGLSEHDLTGIAAEVHAYPLPTKAPLADGTDAGSGAPDGPADGASDGAGSAAE